MVLIFHEFKYVLRLCDMFRFVAFRQQTQNQRMEKEDGGGGSPDAKRKRAIFGEIDPQRARLMP